MDRPIARRDWVAGAAAAGAALAWPGAARAQLPAKPELPAALAPNPAEFQRQMALFIGKAQPQAEGLLLELPVLADNPGAVPVRVKVTLPIGAQDWCEEIVLLADLNPSPLACRLLFTAAAGSAEAAVRLRLSQTQTVHALARMKSGRVLAARQVVTVAASGCGM